MLRLLLITIILMVICFLALGIRIWIKGKFADTEVGHNPNMKKLGLCCAKEEEVILWRKNGDKRVNTTCGICSSCSISAECESHI